MQVLYLFQDSNSTDGDVNRTLKYNETVQNTTTACITCRDGFFKANNTCLPQCDKFKDNSNDALQVSEEVLAGIGICICWIILILSIKNHKRMFNFPSVFMLFMVTDYFIAALIVIIAAVDRTNLLCSSTSLIESYNNPSVFCVVSGAIYQYTLLNMTLWWFFHVSVFLYKVLFPLHAKQIEKLGRQKYIMAALIFLGFLLPLPGIVISLSTEEYEYRLVQFPPSVCSPYGEIKFYFTILVINVLVEIGVCFLIIIFWVLHKHKCLYLKLSAVETKTVVVFCSFIIFAVYNIIYLSVRKAHTEKLINGLRSYFECEAFGYTSGKCDREMFEQYTNPYARAMVYLLMSLIPLSVLIYVINWRSLKDSLSKICIFKTRTKYNLSSSKTSSKLSFKLSFAD